MEQVSRTTLFGGQSAPIGSDGVGRRVLYRCPQCHRVWLQDARSAILDLRAEQAIELARELHATMAQLPHAECRFCLLKRGGGAVYFDEYGAGEGYGLLWEIPHPLMIHVNCAVLSQQWIHDPHSVGATPDILTKPQKFREILNWAKEARPPSTFTRLSPAVCALQAADALPGFGQQETEAWRWEGCLFALACPHFEGEQAVITLMQALAPEHAFDPRATFALWQILMGQATQVAMPGDAH